LDKKIKELLDELEKIENKLVDNINEFSEDNVINDKLIELISNYPNQKEIIKFIVFINDNLTNTQIKYRDAIIDSLNSIISQKKKILKLIDDLHKPKQQNKSNSKDILFVIKDMPYYAWVSITLIFMSTFLFLFLTFHPDKTKTITKAAVEVTNTYKGKK